MSSAKLSVQDTDTDLFETPTDLICPITQDIFKNPVLNALGMVYEKDAIAAHLRERQVDPVTNMPLPSLTLTPVYPIKSRSMEYRERTAKRCVEKACARPDTDASTVQPIRYLRRAAELCVHGEVRVQGLTQETVEYLNAHTSNAYDTHGMELFAEGLRREGLIDQAANVYMRLLESSEGDKALQARVLKQCLACWVPYSSGEEASSSAAPTSDQCAAGTSGAWDREVVPRLASFITAQRAFSAPQIVDIMLEAHQPEPLILSLIEYLLAMQTASSDSSSGGMRSSLAGLGGGSSRSLLGTTSSGASAGEASLLTGTGALSQGQSLLLLKYAQIRFGQLQRRLDAPRPSRPKRASSAGGSSADGGASRGSGGAPGGATHQQGAAKGGRGNILAWAGRCAQAAGRFISRRRRPLLSGASAVLLVLGQDKLAARAIGAGGLLYFSNISGSAGGNADTEKP